MAPSKLPASRRLCALFRTTEPRVALASGAQVYVNFLSLTRRSGWLQGHISKQADVDEVSVAVEGAAAAVAPGDSSAALSPGGTTTRPPASVPRPA